eukprot:scaffold9508_cov169-Skeletonema_menzelii.AAC.3
MEVPCHYIVDTIHKSTFQGAASSSAYTTSPTDDNVAHSRVPILYSSGSEKLGRLILTLTSV